MTIVFADGTVDRLPGITLREALCIVRGLTADGIPPCRFVRDLEEIGERKIPAHDGDREV